MNAKLVWISGCVSVGLLGAALPAGAQTAVRAQPAELSVPFGVAAGHVVLVEDQLVFVNADDPDASFAIDRSNVTSVDSDQQLVTLELRQPVPDGRRQVALRVDEPGAVTSWYERASAASSPRPSAPAGANVMASYQAKHNHRLGSCVGQLIITEDRVAFESVSEINDSRQWAFADIRELTQDGIYKVSITPFIGNGYDLELVGRGLDSEQYRNLVDRIAAARSR